MRRLVNCLDKLVGKLITKADADFLVREALAYQDEGMNPVEAERMAVADAIEQIDNNGESVLTQIQQSVPQALPDAQEYWSRETIRKVGTPLEREARTPEAPVERPVVPQAAPPAQPEAAPPEAAAPPAPETVPPEAAPPAPEAAKPVQPVLPGFREPLTTAQREFVDSLPEAQRAKMEQAFQPNPFPDPHTPLPKKAPTIRPETNRAIPELSKYGVLDPDATAQSVLEKIAADKSLPRWLRTIMDLLVQVGNLDNVEIEAVYLPDSNWPALYANRTTGKSKIYINLAKNLPKGGLPRTIAHEVLHHMTMMKLMDRVPLNDTEAEARTELNRIFQHIQGLPEFEGEYGTHNPWEFASEIFSNESLRAKLNALSLPGSKLTLIQQIRRLLAALGFGGKEIRAGSMLEEAMRQTIKVAGTTAVTGEGTAAMSQARFARVMNEFPQFQNEIINATAPILHDMEITPQERVKDHENAHYTQDEKIKMDKSLDEALEKKGWKLTPEERAKWDDKIAKRVKGVKALFPQSEGWAQHLITPSKIILAENKKGERRAMVEFGKVPYNFDQDKGRGLKTGSVEWQARAEDLANRGVEDLQTRIVDANSPEARVILEQIGWYRSVMDHIRHSYGGMSDLFADLLGTFSPQTQVKQNWEYGIQALKKTMAGDYDELLSRVDKWMKEDPSRTIDDWKALHGEKGMILKENNKLFGQNSIHGMKALLDFWRIVQTGSAPKARNFTANLIGHSYKATIDLWAARFLQRMHLPNFRIPTRVEGDVTGAHMKDVEQIGGQFGLGQEVFKRMAAKLREQNPAVWGEVSPADLQAIMWYGEKHVWESKGWTRILGASNSMKAMAEAEAVNRYELGLSRDRTEKRVTARDQRIHGMKLRNTLSGIAHTVGAKVMDTVSMFQGTRERAWDSEILVYPEYDPQEMIDAVVEVAGTSNQDATHISRVIDTEYEKNNPNARPGITVFFRDQVDLAAVKPVMDELERLNINGFTLQVDQRARADLRPEVMKKGVPDRFFGVRMQFVPEYFSTEQEAVEALPQVIKGISEARVALQKLPNIAYINEVFYDTLVLKKGEYDTTGKLRDAAAIHRAEVWRERARSVGSEAATRRDAVREQIRKTDAEATRLKREADRAEEERIAELSGGVPEEGELVTAAQAQEPQPVTPAKLQREIRSDPDYVYHATNLERLYEIAESGKLKTHKPNEFTEQDAWPDQSIQKRAYFSRNAGVVWSFAPEEGIPIVVRAKGDPSLGTEKSTGDIYSSKPVSASKLEYLGEDNQWHPVSNLRPPEFDQEKIVTAAQAQEYEEGPPIDPVSGRPSLVRAMANAQTDAGGTAFAPGTFPRPGVRRAGGGKVKGGARASSIWQALGDVFRRREAEVHSGFQRAGEGLQRLNPDESKYQTSQRLFDYLTHPDKEVTDPELESEINALREQIPVLSPDAFNGLKQLPKGMEATVLHDDAGKMVYKLFKIQDGKIGNYVPGRMRLAEDNSIRLEKGAKPTLGEFLARVDNVNQHGKVTPMEFTGVLPDGYAVFAQPYVRGKRVWHEDIERELRGLGMKMLTDIGGVAAIGKVGDKHVLFDDLHQDNVRSLPGRFAEIIDAVNRDLTPEETEHLRQLGKLPDDIVTAAQQQEVEPVRGFYSGVAKILNRKMPNAAPPQQVKAIIKDAPQEDIKWSGVNQAIDRLAEENKGKVPKEALLNYLRDDGVVRLEEVTLGKAPEEAEAEVKRLMIEGRQDEARELMRKYQDPRYAQQTLPGGENYREVVLAMPGRGQTFEEYLEASAFNKAARTIGLQGTRDGKSAEQRIDALRERYRQEYEEGKNRRPVTEYTSSHFPNIPNYVAHSRMNDRTDAEGRPGLFLEEIQSDRHQAGREKGYTGEGYAGPVHVTEEKFSWIVRDEAGNKLAEVGKGVVKNQFEAKQYLESYLKTRKSEADAGKVADAPFRKDWPVQMFKRALRDAIASGKEWIGWTSGETQAERYDLSKQVDKIAYGTQDNKLMVWGGGDDEAMISQHTKPEDLPNVIGKEAADRLLNNPTDTTYPGGRFETKILSGVDLKVGGEGMKGFYDRMLPNEIGKYVKQWGGKVEQSEINQSGRKGAEERYVVTPRTARGYWVILDTAEDDRVIGNYDSEELAREAADVFNGDLKGKPAGRVKIWKVEITPQMKETIPVKGQSLFGAVAPQQQVQDENDVVTSPLSPRGHLTRFLAFVSGGRKEVEGIRGGVYRTEGIWSAAGDFNKEIYEALRNKTAKGKELIAESAFLDNKYKDLAKKVYGSDGPTTDQQREINLALGNLENRLTEQQVAAGNRIRDVKKRNAFLDQAERDNIRIEKQKQQAALNGLDPRMRDWVVERRDSVVRMNEALINEANISPDLKQAIEKNKGSYLHRSYKIFEDNDTWKNQLKEAEKRLGAGKVDEMTSRVRAAKNLFRKYVIRDEVIKEAAKQKKAGTPITRAQAVSYAMSLPDIDEKTDNMFDDYINIGDDPIAGSLSLYGGARPGSTGRAIMTERGIVRKEIRELWGEWDNPGVNFAKTYVAAGTFLENDRFQRSVLEQGLDDGWLWKKDDSRSPGTYPRGWKEIAPEDSATMKTLGGVYAPEILVEALKVMNSPVQRTQLSGILSRMMSWPLAAKTVYSTGSIVRNFLGNLAFVYGNGNFTGRYLEAGKVALADALKKGDDAMRAYVSELTRLGVLGDNVVPGMLKDMAKLAQEIDVSKTTSLEGMSKFLDHTQKGAKQLSTIMTNAYSGVDSYWKVYAYEAELAKLKKAWDGNLAAPSEAEMKKQSADIVRRTMPTYSEAWSLLKTTSQVGKFIAPFIKFRTEVIRTSIGTIKQGLEEWNSDNPKIKSIGARRLACSTIAMTLVPAILGTVTKALFGIGDDDEEAIRAALPDWQKNAGLAFVGKDEKGNPRFLDYSYMNPYGVYTNPMTAAMRAYKSGQSIDDALVSTGLEGLKEFFRPYISEQLWLSAAIDIERNQDSQRNFQPLWNAQDTLENKLQAGTSRLIRTLTPGTIDSLDRVWRGLRGEVSKGGKEYSAPNEVLAMIGGARVTTHNIAQGLQTLTSGFERNKRDAEQVFMQPLTNRGTVADGAVTEGYDQANYARKALYYKMRQNYRGSMGLGMTQPEAIQTMMIGFGSEANKKGLSKDDIGAITAGRYIRYTPSKAAITEAARAHPERFREFMKAFNAAPAWEDISD